MTKIFHAIFFSIFAFTVLSAGASDVWVPNSCTSLRTSVPAPAPVEKVSVAVLDSEEWLSLGACGAYVHISLERPSAQRLVQHQTPNWGGHSNMMLVNLLTFCVAAHYGASAGFTHMRMPTKDQIPLPNGSRRITMVFEKSNTKADKTPVPADEDTPMSLAEFSTNCKQLLVDKYLW